MATLIDSAPKAVGVEVGFKMLKGFYIRLSQGWSGTEYLEAQITAVAEIEAETYRSAGKAAAGAIIGGVLTGGVGLLVGAAFGGRRRQEGSYLVHFKDGSYVAFTTKDKTVIKFLQARVLRDDVARRTRDGNPPS